MDYEKMYKEALERAKKFEEKYGGGYAGYIFPELAESEDERIRKFLIDILSNGTWRKEWPFGPNEVVAYLEKQKPAEWSKEDEKRVKQLIYDTEAIRAGYEKRKESLGDDFNDELIKDCDEQIAWLKSLRPQPKQVWTEEDDRICHLIMANLSESARHAITLPMETVNGFNNWLRTLQCMPPVFTDWNEEDQTLLSDALGCVTMVQELKKRGELKDFHISCSYDELRSWVRSLKSRPRKQPHWKPSEEQMGALLNIEGDLRAFQYNDKAKIIAELYEQLKRL